MATKKVAKKKSAKKAVKASGKVKRTNAGTKLKPFSLAAPATGAYARALANYGLLEGAPGKRKISAAVLPLLDALHRVLAGGTVDEIRLRGDVNGEVVAGLDRAMQRALADANKNNRGGPIEVFYG